MERPGLQRLCGRHEVSGLYLSENFLRPDEEDRLIDRIDNAGRAAWKNLSGRRVQNWGGLPHPKGMVPVKLPPWLQDTTQLVHSAVTREQLGWVPESNEKAQAVAPNHVLINEYLPGQGILPHTDGAAYQPVAAILSLLSPIVMEFRPAPKTDADRIATDPVAEVVLRPRSLLVLTGNAYFRYHHGIAARESDRVDPEMALRIEDRREDAVDQDALEWQRERRVSLTIRRVQKTLKTTIRL